MNKRLIRQLAFLVMFTGLVSASLAGESVSLQTGTDRMGGDYKSITLTNADPQLCRQACADDGVCKSYSYVKPGVKGANAMCFLKSSVASVTANDCCSSGVKTVTMISTPNKNFNAPTTKPAVKITTFSPTAADPKELLNQINELRAKEVLQEQTIAELKSLIAIARDDIQAMKTSNKNALTGLSGSVDKLNTNQVALKNQFINFKTGEYDKHYHNLKGILGNVVEDGGALSLRTSPGTLAKEIEKLKKTGIPQVDE